tara:strand:- start:305 stop:619 length:315 start_codon:yes stop_codon:yes gene_type:complete
MIKETSMFLFLLIGGGNSYEEAYIGRIPSCLDAADVLKKAKQSHKYREKIISGYICIDSQSSTARKKFQRKPNPAEEKFINDMREHLPTPMPKPLQPLQRKEIK